METKTKTDNRTTGGAVAFRVARWPNLGRVCSTAGVFNWCKGDEGAGAFILGCLRRHAAMNWGDLCDEDRAANDAALFDGSRIWSAYHYRGRKICIITEAENDEGKREYTTVMFPEEY